MEYSEWKRFYSSSLLGDAHPSLEFRLLGCLQIQLSAEHIVKESLIKIILHYTQIFSHCWVELPSYFFFSLLSGNRIYTSGINFLLPGFYCLTLFIKCIKSIFISSSILLNQCFIIYWSTLQLMSVWIKSNLGKLLAKLLWTFLFRCFWETQILQWH